MNKRVSELEGAELDYWVAVAEGKDPDHSYQRRLPDGSVLILDRLSREEAEAWAEQQEGRSIYRYIAPYSTLWNSGGPIIEQAQINVVRCNDLYFPSGNEHGEYYEQYWRAEIQGNTDLDMPLYREYGPTPLIAAMRAFVASKLGDTVEEAQQ